MKRLSSPEPPGGRRWGGGRAAGVEGRLGVVLRAIRCTPRSSRRGFVHLPRPGEECLVLLGLDLARSAGHQDHVGAGTSARKVSAVRSSPLLARR